MAIKSLIQIWEEPERSLKGFNQWFKSEAFLLLSVIVFLRKNQMMITKDYYSFSKLKQF